MTDRLQLAYVSHLDPNDPRAWSGTVAAMARALQSAGADVHNIGPLNDPAAALSGARKAAARMRGRLYLRDREPRTIDAWARQAQQAVERSAAQCILSPSTLPISHMRTALPRAVWIDAPFAAMHASYPAFSRLDAASVRHGNEVDASALRAVDAAIFASTWARDAAIEAYDVDPARCHVVPFGANLDSPDAQDVQRCIDARSTDRLELLFLAVRWQAKGGDVAYDVARHLNERGIPTRLTVVGVSPELDGPPPDWLESAGFIDKSTADGRAAFDALVSRSHLLLFPTRFDAYGLAIAEANAWGVPALAPDFAGPASIVRGGQNGLLMAPDASVEKYVEAVMRVWSDHGAYSDLARASHQEYRERLNWSVAGDRVLAILQDICDR